MEGTLYKSPNGEHYYLTVDGKIFAEIGGHPLKSINQSLSPKNCQSIERGYDLDELADEHCNRLYYEGDVNWDRYRLHFKEGFKKALELLGDKKFSINDILVAMICMQGQEVFYEKTFEETQETRKLYIENYIKHLQQTEWDVSVEMEQLVTFASMPKEGEVRRSQQPKLDSDGNLILKRI